MNLGTLAGLGPASQAMLALAGIDSAGTLRELGAVQAYVMVKRAGCKPSLNLLWGLESALAGVPWQEVARLHRTSLLMALDHLERSGQGKDRLPAGGNTGQ